MCPGTYTTLKSTASNAQGPATSTLALLPPPSKTDDVTTAAQDAKDDLSGVSALLSSVQGFVKVVQAVLADYPQSIDLYEGLLGEAADVYAELPSPRATVRCCVVCVYVWCACGECGVVCVVCGWCACMCVCVCV